MKKFMDDNFLLSNNIAEDLFHNYAKNMPIIDYHCHLSPKEIYMNKRYSNITEVWLYGDHYKWRAMRAAGVDESLITGDANDYDRFMAWAETVPKLIGNPLYNWTHLELQRYFGINEILNKESGPSIWKKVNKLLIRDDFGVRDLINRSNVQVVCTTDDPIDDLSFHQMLVEDDEFSVKVLPGFRPDKAIEINQDGFIDYVDLLEKVTSHSTKTYDGFLRALRSRIDYFHQNGCRVSDHALNTMMFTETTKENASNYYEKAISGQKISLKEESDFKSFTLVFLGEQYAEKEWVMQYHINALRNNNSRMYNYLGPDTGYDAMNDEVISKPLVNLLNELEKKDRLPKTILYSLNPNDNPVIASIIGSFQSGRVPGKLQFGTAWWFNDTKSGMIKQMQTLADIGVFSQFIGMLTDSRSFLSYPRHEYFRRLVCSLVGEWVYNGEVPYDLKLLGKIIQDISYYNAARYFDFGLISDE
ncbi:glucuronate isomerase [Oceanobacillus kimchii]|uniref:Uronate isomerase n=1 Tax=Oceanobacillus kimchii TaxID=746691 RepID=A0ABQ5TEW9_9BACI|nr:MULTISPECIES: glucuronate isomerase [Oceanobacillus]MCT1577643.1 glucuronate isomerase [Oceanobacillus kimchii]MCT2136631.1 glucuronate isomerase [Oceanobacillus kimchii]GLO64637.1 uronate isomerase [Oceanobacillus kimchii]